MKLHKPETVSGSFCSEQNEAKRVGSIQENLLQQGILGKPSTQPEQPEQADLTTSEAGSFPLAFGRFSAVAGREQRVHMHS